MTKPTAGKGEVLLPHTLNHLLSKILALQAAAVAEAVAPGPHGQAEGEGGSATRLLSVPRCLEETPSRRVHSEQRSQTVSEKPLPCALGGVCLPLSSLGGTSVSPFRYMTRSYPCIRVNGGGKEPSGTGTQPPLVWPQCLCVSFSHLSFLGLSDIFTRLGSKHRLPWSSCGMEGMPSPR